MKMFAEKSFFRTLFPLFFVVSLLVAQGFYVPVALAQETNPEKGLVPCGRDAYQSGDAIPAGKSVGDLKNPCGFSDAIELARRLITGLIMLAVLAAAVGIAYAGYLYITAMGSEEKIRHAHSIFLKVAVGFAVMLSAWLIVKTIENAFLSDEQKARSFLED